MYVSVWLTVSCPRKTARQRIEREEGESKERREIGFEWKKVLEILENLLMVGMYYYCICLFIS